MNKRKIKILILYFFLIAGGLWHILGLFQYWMELLASPVITAIAMWILIELLQSGKVQNTDINRLKPHKLKTRIICFSSFVFILSWFIEYIGVRTGALFGEYKYGETLYPLLAEVPFIIGFAWFTALFSSTALMQKINYFGNISDYGKALLIGLFMVVFDAFMEPAAVKLDYWHWSNNLPPIQNYLIWFIMGYLFALTGLKIQVLKVPMPHIALHAYFAQLIYFSMIYFK